MHFVDAKGILTGSRGHYGMNVYRGCTHGCIYCDSRSTCYQFTHPFEDIEVKRNAPELLEKALRAKRQKCMIGTGSMSDPYMHCEEQLRLTRRCLEVILRYGFGAAVQTKSDRILEDINLLSAIHRQAKCVVQMTLTTWDDDLCEQRLFHLAYLLFFSGKPVCSAGPGRGVQAPPRGISSQGDSPPFASAGRGRSLSPDFPSPPRGRHIIT